MGWKFNGVITTEPDHEGDPDVEYAEWINEDGVTSRMGVAGWKELGSPTEHPHPDEVDL